MISMRMIARDSVGGRRRLTMALIALSRMVYR
jgi:hypothetical protein